MKYIGFPRPSYPLWESMRIDVFKIPLTPKKKVACQNWSRKQNSGAIWSCKQLIERSAIPITPPKPQPPHASQFGWPRFSYPLVASVERIIHYSANIHQDIF
jgi:hypothetical protein